MKQRALIYCCKGKPYLFKRIDKYATTNLYNGEYIRNGKIVCECEVETEEIECVKADFNDFIEYHYITKHLQEKDLIKRSCVDFPTMQNYLKLENGYALHLTNVKVFDNPRELSDYTTRKERDYDSIVCDSCTNFGCDCKKCSNYYDYTPIRKAPQNMMRVCEWDLKDYVLISIRAEWVCKILNGEKSIELRRKVLKGML